MPALLLAFFNIIHVNFLCLGTQQCDFFPPDTVVHVICTYYLNIKYFTKVI